MGTKCKANYTQILIVAISAAVFICVVLPFQVYLGNMSLFEFGWMRLLLECITYTAVLFAALVMFQVLGDLVVRHLVGVGIFAVLLCLYLETGILSSALPPINGDVHVLENAYQKVLDTSVLSAAVIVSVCSFKWIRCYVHWLSLVILVMGFASLFDVKIDQQSGVECEMSDGFCSKYEVAKSLEYSPTRNILVFILDATPASAADFVGNDEDLRAAFSGFVAYRNNIGMHEGTLRGLPGLMTGDYFQKNDSSAEYTMRIFGAHSLLSPYVKANLPVYFSGALFNYGYTNKKKDGILVEQQAENVPASVFLRNTTETPYLNLLEILKFRACPFAKKFSVVISAMNSKNVAPSVIEEKVLFPILASAGMSSGESCMLGVFHTFGVHSPLRDRNGNWLHTAESVEGINDAMYYVLSELKTVLQRLRKKGVYDNSFIVVASDHGSGIMSDNPEEMGAASAMLFVKPFGSTGDFHISDMPTSHSKISGLVKMAKDKDLTIEDVNSMLLTSRRVFRGRPHGTMHFYEWIYDEGGKVIEKTDLGVFTCK